MPSERQYRREVVSFGKMLHQRGYVAAMDGNLSVRLDELQHETASTVAAGEKYFSARQWQWRRHGGDADFSIARFKNIFPSTAPTPITPPLAQ